MDVIIERIGRDDNGKITFVDLHDETNGTAVFCETISRHYHGKYKTEELDSLD